MEAKQREETEQKRHTEVSGMRAYFLFIIAQIVSRECAQLPFSANKQRAAHGIDGRTPFRLKLEIVKIHKSATVLMHRRIEEKNQTNEFIIRVARENLLKILFT